MTGAGWIVMLLSVGAVTALFVWTLFRVLAGGSTADKCHGTEDGKFDASEGKK